MRGLNPDQNRSLRRWLREVYGNACAYCHRHIGKRGTVDHYLPKALGGDNDRHNLRWCCLACNRAKADMHPDAWAAVAKHHMPRLSTKADRRQRLLQLASPRGRLRLLGQAAIHQTPTYSEATNHGQVV